MAIGDETAPARLAVREQGTRMIVKFHARGERVAVVRLITCWEGSVTGKGQRCFRGNPEEVRELIDATPFAKKYTSGVLSFAEKGCRREDVKK